MKTNLAGLQNGLGKTAVQLGLQLEDWVGQPQQQKEFPETPSGQQPRGKKTPQLCEKEAAKYRI